MTQTVTDAKTLYEVSADFRAMIGVWVDERRCPLPLVDYLLELGLESQAECARWCATEKERADYVGGRFRLNGPYPKPDINGQWYWFTLLEGPLSHAADVPLSKTGCRFVGDAQRHAKAENAILWLMDNWKVQEQAPKILF